MNESRIWERKKHSVTKLGEDIVRPPEVSDIRDEVSVKQLRVTPDRSGLRSESDMIWVTSA